MDPYEELLRKLGLWHLKDDPEALREAVLKELGMFEMKDKPEEIMKESEKKIEESRKKLAETAKEIGSIIQKDLMKRTN